MSEDIPLKESFELDLVRPCLLRTILEYSIRCKSHKSPNLISLQEQLEQLPSEVWISAG